MVPLGYVFLDAEAAAAGGNWIDIPLHVWAADPACDCLLTRSLRRSLAPTGRNGGSLPAGDHGAGHARQRNHSPCTACRPTGSQMPNRALLTIPQAHQPAVILCSPGRSLSVACWPSLCSWLEPAASPACSCGKIAGFILPACAGPRYNPKVGATGRSAPRWRLH